MSNKKGKKNTDFFTVPVDIYNMGVCVVIGNDIKWACKCINTCHGKGTASKEDFGEATQGRLYMSNKDYPVVWLKSLKKNPKDLNLMSHEIFHTVRFIMNLVGIPLSDDTNEAYAYLTGYLTEQIIGRTFS